MRLCSMRFTPKLTNKWKLFLLVLLMAIVILIYHRFSFNARRPKTLLIYNSEYLCASEVPTSGRRNHQSVSQSRQTSIVIMIPSSRRNYLQRSLIRETYGSYRNLNNVNILGVVFVLGGTGIPAARNATTDIEKLDAEWDQFGDIVVGDFSDTYRNLSRKSIMAYDWLVTFCQEADLVVKTDDDVLVDIFKLTAELATWTPNALKSFNFWCAVHSHESIDRNKKSIYYISREEYPKKRIPKHCAGVGYVTPMGVIRLIADEISKSFLGPICSHEDVFMTGIVPEQINSARKNSIQHVNKMADWVFYIDENNANKDGKYIWNAISGPAHPIDDFEEFRKRSGKRVFYLLQHDSNYKRKFMRLWHFVKNSFKNNKTTNKVDIN